MLLTLAEGSNGWVRTRELSQVAVWLPGGSNSGHNQVKVEIQVMFKPACGVLDVFGSHDSRGSDPSISVWRSFGCSVHLLCWVKQGRQYIAGSCLGGSKYFSLH